jgi:hypothetical protein
MALAMWQWRLAASWRRNGVQLAISAYLAWRNMWQSACEESFWRKSACIKAGLAMYQLAYVYGSKASKIIEK